MLAAVRRLEVGVGEVRRPNVLSGLPRIRLALMGVDVDHQQGGLGPASGDVVVLANVAQVKVQFSLAKPPGPPWLEAGLPQ